MQTLVFLFFPLGALYRNSTNRIQRALPFFSLSTDALCRDDTSEISRHPCTKRLQTRRESTLTQLLDSYLGLACLQFATRESAHMRFHDFHVIIFIIIIIIFLSKPAISLPEQASALIFSPNVSIVDVSVHGHQAIVFLSP